ncbi:MAG: glycosyltransferase family 2 protein [Porphyromonadaceae bacterium]|jgi:glycosyltransferase involved in cell wall biosynthesis|nr:glycosyltransferase family 2 protein [Porphyromonadaceae bacterium]
MAEELSVIIPVFNREKLVCRCLDSVKAQTYRPLHVIVVDNDSTDTTFRTVTEWGRANAEPALRMSLLSEKKPGAAAARNRGFQQVKGDKLCFFDSDDTMRPDFAAEVMKAFDLNPAANLVTWRTVRHELNGRRHLMKYASDNFLINHIFHCVFVTMQYAVRRPFFSNHGIWNENLMAWNDYELGFRMLLADPNVAAVPKVLADKHQLGNSITGTSFAPRAGVWERSLETMRATAAKCRRDDRDRLLRLIDYRFMLLAAQYGAEGERELAEKLRRETLARFEGTSSQRRFLNAVYHYRRHGGRGSAHIANLLL